MITLNKQIYVGKNLAEYMLITRYSYTTNTYAVYLVNETGYTKIAGASFTNKPSIAILNNVFYMAAKENDIKYAYIDSDSSLKSGTISNAPQVEFIISAKNRLFAGGITISNYTTGTAVFTLNNSGVTGTNTKFLTNIRAGDKIGTGASPTKYYTVARVLTDTTLTLTENFAEATTSNAAYKATRTISNIVYYSAEECFTDWILSGVAGGDDAAYIALQAPNTGLYNYDDAVLLFTEDNGFFIDGFTVADWTVPKNTRFPVGCVSNDSIISKNDYLSFMSKKGVYVTKGGSLRLDSFEAEAYSDIINTYIQDIDQSKAKNITSYIYKDWLIVSVPSISNYSDTGENAIYSDGTVLSHSTSINNSTYTTGLATFTSASKQVDGSDTPAWIGNIAVGDAISTWIDPFVYYSVVDVISNTELQIEKEYIGDTVTNGLYQAKKQYYVEGFNTEFTKHVTAGDFIKFSTNPNYYEIESVVNDNMLKLKYTLKEEYPSQQTPYVIQKRRNNRLLILDTTVNIEKKSFGWTVYDGFYVDSFTTYKQKTYYGSSVEDKIYEFDIGGTIGTLPITSNFKTARENCGFQGKKLIAGMNIPARGTGTIYITPYIDGIAGDTLYHVLNNSLDETQDIFFPRAGQPFKYIGNEIELFIEMRGSNETAYIYPPQYGWLPINKTAGKRIQ